jgi:hypothetical protein
MTEKEAGQIAHGLIQGTITKSWTCRASTARLCRRYRKRSSGHFGRTAAFIVANNPIQREAPEDGGFTRGFSGSLSD